MSRHWKLFVADECGALLVSDWAFLATILVMAVIPSMVGLQDKTTKRSFDEFQAKKALTTKVSDNR
jgi:hypothetical protein